MGWNNWSYTEKKQKEMIQKSTSYQQGIEGLKPLYKPYYNNTQPTNTSGFKKEKERQYRIKLISIFVISLECIIGIGVILYFSVYGT